VRTTIATALALVWASGFGTTAVAQASAPSPKHFSAHVTNPFFPLAPGSRYVYTGEKDGKRGRDVVTVTHRVAKIDGVPCVPVRDRLFLEGRLAERTTDWYTQDRRGNVWYFGERTAELDARGRVTSREGSWRTGFRGAKPGIFMPAHPRVGLAFRQEFFKGHAEDHFRIVGLFSTMAGSHAKNALLTREWTPLEPGVIDHKLYVRGIGDVVEQTVEGGNERFELVSFRP
jgi:hypothetical protein